MTINKTELSYLNITDNLSRYCIKTGKLLNQIPFNECEQLIAIHGEEQAKLVISKLQQSISLEWILTDNIALNKLSSKQPIEYLIYALSALLKKPQPDNTLEILQDFNEKIASNKSLQQYPIAFIQIVSELIRRILAANRPVAIQEMLDNCNMMEICATIEELTKFQLTLQACLKQIGIGYYDDKLINDRNRKKKELFARQNRIIALTDLEKEISASLPDFDEITLPLGELRSIIMGNATTKLKYIAKQESNVKKQLNAKSPLSNHKNLYTSNSKSFAGIKFKTSKDE